MSSRIFRPCSGKKSGFTLVELAIVLAVASLLFAGMWRLMSGGSTQMRDQASADQMQQLIAAVKGYLGTQEGGTFLSGKAAPFSLGLPSGGWNSVAGCKALTTQQGFCDFLPTNFSQNTLNSYGQAYSIRLLADGNTPANAYSFMVETTGGETIADTSGGRVAGLVGSDGGFIYSTDVCNAAAGAGSVNDAACGAYGSWAARVSSYFGGAGASGHLATRTSVVNGTDTSMWLARKEYAPVSDYNTMQTNLYFKNPPNAGGNNLFLGGNTFYGGSTTVTPPTAGSPPEGIIENFKEVNLYMSAAGDPSALTVTAGGTCANGSVTYPHAACNNALTVNGDQYVKGVLYANRLFADYFIYITTSDERLKHDIKTLEHPLDDLSKIRALSFVMNSNDEKKLGVVSQDIEKVYPELVQDMGDGYKGVDYIGLIGPMIGAIQELKSQNDNLRAQVQEQARMIKSLQKGK